MLLAAVLCCRMVASEESFLRNGREDAHAALQLYHLHVKGDLALMSYQELVEHELRSMHFPAASDLA